MIEILIKQDEFLFKSHLKTILKKISPVAERDFNFDEISAKTHGVEKIVSIYQTPPMMAESRTLIVEDIDKLKKEELDVLAKLFKKTNDFCHLILICEKLDKRTSFFKTLKPIATVHEFKKPYANQIPQFISQKAREIDLQLEPGSAELLVESIGTDLMSLFNELEKLKIFAGEKKTISQKELLSVLAGGILENIFDLTEALGNKDLKRSNSLFQRFFEQGEPVIKTVSLVITHFRKILLTRETLQNRQSQPLESLLGVHPFFVKNYQNQAKKFSLKSLNRIYKNLLDLSQNLRSQGASPEALFEDFLQKTCLSN